MTNNYVSYNDGESGSIIRGKLNNAAHDTQKGIKIVNTFADIANINYYDTTSIVFVIDEKKYYKHNGSSWVIYRDIGSGLPTDQITLLHVADNSTEKFDLTDAGLDLAIAEIATGDLLLLPPHIFTQSHTFATKCTVSALFPINSFWIANTSNLVKFTGGVAFSADCSIDGIWFYRYVSDNANPVFALTIGGYCTVSNCIIEGGNSFSLSPLAGGGVSTTAYCEFYNCRIRNISSGTSYAVYDQGNEPEFYNCYLGNLQNPNDCYIYNSIINISGVGISYRVPRFEVNPSSGMTPPSYSGSVPSILTLSNSSDKNGWINKNSTDDSNEPYIAEFYNDTSLLSKLTTGYRDTKGGLAILANVSKRLYLGTGLTQVDDSNLPAITIEDDQNVGIGNSLPLSALDIVAINNVSPLAIKKYGSTYKVEITHANLGADRTITFPDATGTVSLDGHTHTFVSLTDTPNNYTSQATKLVSVNAGATAVEFVDRSSIASSIKLDDLATPDDNTDLDATSARHGLLPKLSNNSAEFLDGTGVYAQVDWFNVINRPVVDLSTFYLHEEDSDIVGYEWLLTTPANGTEQIDSVSVTSAGGELVIDEYISEPINKTMLSAGIWTFMTYGRVDNTAGVSEIITRVYKRNLAGTETELFNVTTGEINSTSVLLYTTEVVQPDFIVAETDRIVVKYFGKTTNGGAISVFLYYEGTSHYSHVHVPFAFTETSATSFLGLSDTPNSFSGEAGKIVVVNGTETGLGFATNPAGNGHEIQEEGVALTQQPVLDFQGAGVTVTDGTGKTIVTIPGGSSPFDYILIRDEKPQNTSGGTFTSGAWQTRDLNTEVSDAGNHASVSSNQITLSAGTYICNISAPAYVVNNHQARLYNITDNELLALGTSERATNINAHITRSFIHGPFTLSGTKTIEVQHYCTSTFSGGFGEAANIGTEIYTVAEFWKIA